MDSRHQLTHQLDTLLNDSEGVQQFHKFLSSSFSSGHLLDFWFACKGFRSIVDGDDQLKLLQVAKAIYRTYIKTDAALSVPVNESTKREIRSTLAAFSQSCHNSINGEKRFPVLRSLFDAAQADIQNLLARSYFLEFLQSDSFRMIHHLPLALECNISLPGKSSHHDQSDNVKWGVNPSSINSQQCRSLTDNGEGISISVTDSIDQNSSSVTVEQSDIGVGGSVAHTKPSNCGTIASDKSRRTTAAESTGGCEMVTASELIAYMNPAVVGTSSTAVTTNGSQSKSIATTNVISNTEVTAAVATNTRKPGTNLAEVDPNAFAQTLSHRLEKVKESRGKMERLLSRMQPIDAEEGESEDAELISIQAEVNKAPSPPLPTRTTRLSSSSRRATSAASGGDLFRRKLSALVPLPPVSGSSATAVVPSADDAQVILEDHCSRIWTDERRGQPLNVCRKGGGGGGRRSDVYSISSFDSGVGTCGGGGGGLNSSDSESCVSRGGALHHHHHHQGHHQHYRWNNYPLPMQLTVPPPPHPPMCSFCRRTPSMSSTPAAHRKEAMGGSGSSSYYRWGVQYQRMQQYHHHGHSHHYNIEESDSYGGAGRSMRSRSLTSDSPSVFDSGLSSTYDHLPPPRRSRHDEHKLVQQTADGATPTFGGRITPLPEGELTQRLLGDCETGRNAAPAALTTNLDLLNPGYLPPSTRPERQKYVTTGTTARSMDAPPLKTTPGFPSLLQQPSSQAPTFSLVVGYYLCDDPVPYRTIWTGQLGPDTTTTNPPSITLGQFKQLVAKKGVYRYFFKTASDDFGTGCVHEEVGDDNAILPLWEGKVIARVERAD